jgi:hypothetical protein
MSQNKVVVAWTAELTLDLERDRRIVERASSKRGEPNGGPFLDLRDEPKREQRDSRPSSPV